MDDLAAQHEIYKTEGEPWVLSDHIVNDIVGLRRKMAELHTSAVTKRERAKVARVAMEERFDMDTKRLRIIYQKAIYVWVNESPDLTRFGMLPNSGIWTKMRPPTPKEFRFDAEAELLRWQPVEGVESYEAHYRIAGEGGHWTAFYEGAENSCSIPEGLTGEYDFRIRAIASGKESHWNELRVEIG